MKKLATAALMAVIGLFVGTTSASAQFIYVGGGGSFPMSDYGDYADTGFLLVAGGGIPLGEAGLNAGVEVFWGQNNHTDVDGDKTTPYGVLGGLEYDFDTGGSLMPYIFGQAGLLVHKYSSDTAASDSQSGFAYGAGAGVSFPLGGVNGWVEGRFLSASIDSSTTAFAGALAGISVPLG